LRLPGFQQKQPTGGEVETGRGKKAKKAGWHLKLGLKETIFAGIGVVGLMMMSFALGALAGRGDIYRAASSWGLMSPEGPKAAQWTPGTSATSGELAATPVAPPAPETAAAPIPPAGVPIASAPVAASPPQTPATVPAPVPAAKPAQPAPVIGSIAPLPPPVAPATAKKKGKTGTSHRDPKAREEELRQVRQEMVKNLKFQNSFDTALKARLPKAKEHEKAQAKPGGAKSQPTELRVAQYRNSKEAQAKVTELQKKGVKATLRTAKDSKGTVYIVCKPASSPHSDPEKLAKKPEKNSGVKKPSAE
jgi:hypothetical protein